VVQLASLLEDGEVLLHPWVLGEIALGSLGRKRSAILSDLALLPTAPIVDHDEVLAFVDHHALAGSGLGWVDTQLMASARLIAAELWTNDRRLARAWQDLRSARRG
jgi:predicted nucleic acid-binding protein